ncbi:MAG TPA: DEAD/DEAH box helicase family protein [Deltaproteobacteria bacterium]|nr:DEAD/DEAH box helicase family protein [Deltaproteobacteria bacterium]
MAAEEVASYAVHDGGLLKDIVTLAAEFHDLGKLDRENQEVLSGKCQAKKLPVQHTDAGTAYLLDTLQVPPGAVLVRSHHIGLPDFIEEQNRDERTVLRDETVLERVNRTLPELIKVHQQELQKQVSNDITCKEISGDVSLFYRIALSCLVDGDHADTAIHYGDQYCDEPSVYLLPEKRLAALDQYVKKLETDGERSKLRSEVYEACRHAEISENIVSCDSPVGTGKTTAVMAHLLAQAHKKGLRRIIVVLPFTNIITQSVKVYREALTLPGENSELVVAELHHRADFEDMYSRQYTALWKAPIIVTTAVSFFETLASNSSATLRKLHKLPGSAVFIDESHAALPAKLLPIAWRWIKIFAQEWGCYWVLASGSLNRFWRIEEFDKQPPHVPEIMSDELRKHLMKHEEGRIVYKFHETSLGVKDLVEWVASLPGPRIVILNTVQSAAVVALEYSKRFGRSSVEHLSTSLMPNDRDHTLTRIKSRLEPDNNETDWTLIATSCVEAGVDLSFKTGVREAASLVSLLQTSGRVNRHEHTAAETVWTFVLKEERLLKRHPGMKDSSKVLLDLIVGGSQISPDLCTDALKREIRLAGTFSCDLFKAENNLRFPQVERDFRVITSDTRTVVVENDVVTRLEKHEPVDWREIQKSSVQLWAWRIDILHIPEVSGHHGMFKWTYAYDDFIGYMAGILSVEAFTKGIGDACII